MDHKPAPDGPDGGVTPDWMDAAEWQRYCAARAGLEEQEPPEDEEEWDGDPECAPPAGMEDVPLAVITAQAEADGAEHAALMARLIAAGLDGYAHRRGDPPVPGVHGGPAAGFGQGLALDGAAPCAVLAGLADEASGADRGFAGVSDDQLMGLVGARQRQQSWSAWELLTAVAEFIRRRPAPGCPLEGPARMPRLWSEHACGELAVQLHLSAGAADELLGLARDLAVKLPGTSAALRDGIIDWDKARVIAGRCLPLTAAEARAAEAIVFAAPGVEEMTWGMVRDRIARAVIQVNPEAVIRRREEAARQRRVEVWAEDSGNAVLAGRELPPAAALAASQILTARARQLRAAGIGGGMDELRVLAYLEKLGVLNPLDGSPVAGGAVGGTDTGDGPDTGDPQAGGPETTGGPDGDDGPDGGDGPADGNGGGPDTGGPDDGGGNGGGNGGRGPDEPGPGGPGRPGGAAAVPGEVPAGFAARVNLTLPLATVLGLAERAGVMPRIGAIDPALVRDLAAAAARNPRSTWCLTITGPDGRPVAHGCGRPPPRGSPRGRDDPGGPGTAARDGPVYLPGDGGPPGSGTVRLNLAALTQTAAAGGDLVFALEPLAGPCDHRYQARGHDPGARLRHLTGILNACCTFPPCRRPEAQSDYEHSTPFERGGRTCLCEAGPVCRHNHRDKQAPGWHLEPAGARGWFRWTTPSGRSYLSGPTQYPD